MRPWWAEAKVKTVNDIAVDSNGHAYVTGSSSSSNFPTTQGAYNQTLNGSDAIVFKLNPTGTDLVYSTFLGGSSSDEGWAIAVNASGNAYVAGETVSSNFPTTPGALSATRSGYNELFVCGLSADGSGLIYSTLIGGNNSEYVADIAANPSGAAYLTGKTGSSNFPTTPGALNEEFGSEGAGFRPKAGQHRFEPHLFHVLKITE